MMIKGKGHTNNSLTSISRFVVEVASRTENRRGRHGQRATNKNGEREKYVTGF